MWMPKDELVSQLVAHIGNVELLLFLRYLSVEADVQQHVAQLFADIGRIVTREGVAQLVGFFYGVGAQALIGLFLIPGALLA